MKIDEKEKLLIFILSVVLLVFFYIMFLVPSMLSNIDSLRSESNELDKKIAEVNQMGNVIRDYKVLNMKIGAFLKGYFQDINQEKIILVLDDLLKMSSLDGSSISFNFQQAFNDVAALANYPSLSANITLDGPSFNVFKYMELVGKYNKKILISDLSLNASNNSVDQLNGQIGLQFLGINGGLISSSNSNTIYPSNKGSSNPFSTSSVVNIDPSVDLAKLLLDQLKGGNSDFTLLAKPQDSDLPTVVLGLENDRQAETYVYADNAMVEDVTIRLFKKPDGGYCYQYSTTEVSYPQNDAEGSEIPFATGNTQIMLKIYSDLRKGADDGSGVSLTVDNETDLPLVIEVKSEDPNRPRVEFKDLKGNISVFNAQGVLIQSGVAEMSNEEPAA